MAKTLCDDCDKRFKCYTEDTRTLKNERGKLLPRARRTIIKELPFIDFKPYSHNIISLTLAHVAKECSYRKANQLIDEFNLKAYGWHKERKTKGG